MSRSHARSTSPSSPPAFSIDRGGLAQFSGNARPSHSCSESNSANVPMPCSAVAAVGGARQSSEEQIKLVREKLIRGVEEEEEKRTLGLLHKWNQFQQGKIDHREGIETPSDEGLQMLHKGHKMNVCGSAPTREDAKDATATPTLMSPGIIRRFVPSPAQMSEGDDFARFVSPSLTFAGRSRRSGSLLSSPVASCHHLKSFTSGDDTSRSTSRAAGESSRVGGDIPVEGKAPLVGLIAQSLEEAQRVEDKMHVLEAWVEDMYKIGTSLRAEVIELRDKLQLPTQDVPLLSPVPSQMQVSGHHMRSKTVICPSSKHQALKVHDLSIPTPAPVNQDGFSPLHCAAIVNRRNSKGLLDAPLTSLTPTDPLSVSLDAQLQHDSGEITMSSGSSRVAEVGDLRRG